MRAFARIRNDVVFFRSAMRALRRVRPVIDQPGRIFPFVVDELADRFGPAPALLSVRETFTYRMLAERTNRYARWALAHNIAKGDVVGLMMPNRPDYVAIWLSVTKVGGIVALVNGNLVGRSLAHCIDIVAPRHVIVAAEYRDTWQTAVPLLQTRPQVWIHGSSGADGEAASDAVARLDDAIGRYPGDALTRSERRPLTTEGRALYIYTSGTTGLPKAANVNHFRVMLAHYGFHGAMNTKPTDRLYNCLPMHHTTGGLCAIGSVLLAGGSVAIAEKFSARTFWDDVAHYDCTMFQYVGELCRYLVHAPPHPRERQHRLRLACGNGLRGDIWETFRTRFQIPRILEFYAATEGNVLLFNFDGRPGALGRRPKLLARRYPVALIALADDQRTPMRDARGFCVCEPVGEAGEMIGLIGHDPKKPGSRFEGYADSREDERKILRNVFAAGDAWFRTGDLMRQDADGYYYFVDRIGDTFRWKGENVATAEVADVLCGFPGLFHATVYGVVVPGHDGRAGMAAFAGADDVDLAALHAHLNRSLPSYAQPLFLRRRDELDVTATFKQKKTDLVREGFDPALVRDALYFNDRARETFVPLDATLFDRIVGGEIKL
jgi:fatty-acyl-CoA synthase